MNGIRDNQMYSVEHVADVLAVSEARVTDLCFRNVLDAFPEGHPFVLDPARRIHGRSVLLYTKQSG
jgi:hypothetical protein